MRRTRRVSVLLLALYLPACNSYRLVANPATAIPAEPKVVEAARITYRSGERVVVKSPYVEGDSLRGTWPDGQPGVVALSDISYTEVKTPDSMKTGGLALGVVVVAIAAAIAYLFVFVVGD